MRLFIAVDVTPWIRRAMNAAQRQLPPQGLQLVEPSKMHISLMFLGDVSPKKIPGVQNKLRGIECEPFEVVIKGMGAFPNEQYVRTVWAGCRTKELKALGEKVQAALPEFPKEEFTGHITIARVNKRVGLRSFFAMYKDFRFGDFIVEKFYLMASELTPSGPVYSIISEYDLKEKGEDGKE